MGKSFEEQFPFASTYREPQQECLTPEEVKCYVFKSAPRDEQVEMDTHLRRCPTCAFAVAEAEKAVRK